MPTIPRLPLVPDPLRRIRVPRHLESVTSRGREGDPEAVGMSSADVEGIWHHVERWYRSGVHPAIQVCVRREGEVVLDRAVGHSRGNGPADPADAKRTLCTPRTPFLTYSASKAVTAFVVHKLIERGLVGLDTPVCEYIPGYDCHGKEGITIGHVLSHRAGVPNIPREAMDLDRAGDRDFLVEQLCDARPFAKPGRYLAYHAVSGGFILGEVVHQVTGKDIRQVLAEEFLGPLGFRWTSYGVAEEDLDEVAIDYSTGARLLPPLSNLIARALGATPDDLVDLANDPRFRTGIVPAGNLVSTANEFSLFYEVLRRGGELDGTRVIEADTIRTALTEQSHLDIDFTLGFPTRFGYGVMLGAQLLSLFGRDTQHAFGHLGYTNILTWADPERGLAAAVMTNGKPTLYPEVGRFLGLMQRITSAAPKVPAGDRAL
jgi:CubicO group peptidase (beta-lactamase class C family)